MNLLMRAFSKSRLSLAGVTLLFASGCNFNALSTDNLPSVPLKNASTPLAIPTYEASGQATEPSVVSFDRPWHGFRYWMAFSPYPQGDESKENPSIGASDDGVDWHVPAGLINPLEFPMATDHHFADASIFYDRTSDQLWVYYLRETHGRGTQVHRMISRDGIRWEKRDGVLFKVATGELESPSVAIAEDKYYMWTVNTSAEGCLAQNSRVEYRSSKDGVKWSASRHTDMLLPGYIIWHLNISYIEAMGEYWAALTAYRELSDCEHTLLFYAKSKDAIKWDVFPTPILSPGVGWDDREIYRSSLLFEQASNRLRIWYSAASGDGKWHLGLTEADHDQFLKWIGAADARNGVPSMPTEKLLIDSEFGENALH